MSISLSLFNSRQVRRFGLGFEGPVDGAACDYKQLTDSTPDNVPFPIMQLPLKVDVVWVDDIAMSYVG